MTLDYSILKGYTNLTKVAFRLTALLTSCLQPEPFFMWHKWYRGHICDVTQKKSLETTVYLLKLSNLLYLHKYLQWIELCKVWLSYNQPALINWSSFYERNLTRLIALSESKEQCTSRFQGLRNTFNTVEFSISKAYKIDFSILCIFWFMKPLIDYVFDIFFLFC